jgi:probable F420-dependent oxidoreductase
MKYWLIAPWLVPEEMIELARHAEELGFEGLMGADHGFIPQSMAANYPYAEDGKPPITGDMPYPDVWTTITAMAMVTERLKFSTAVYVLPLRHPVEVAKATGNIARLSNNRLVLGAGVGWMREEFAAYGVDFKTRGRRMDEMIDVLRTLWRGGYVEHHGEFFDFDPLQLAPAPSQPIPIYIGGSSEMALRRAARCAQGWIGTGNVASEVPALLEQLNSLRREYGRQDEPFDSVVALTELDDLDTIRRLEGLGMTSMVFGFVDRTLDLDGKRVQMEMFAEYLMRKL